MGRGTAPLSHSETRGMGEYNIKGSEGCPGWDSDSRGLEKPRYTEQGLSVLVQGWELAALSARQQRWPWSHSPLPLLTQGQGTTEHPGCRIAPSPISELISHLNSCLHHTKHELSCVAVTPQPQQVRTGGGMGACYTPAAPVTCATKAVTDKISKDSKQGQQ